MTLSIAWYPAPVGFASLALFAAFAAVMANLRGKMAVRRVPVETRAQLLQWMRRSR